MVYEKCCVRKGEAIAQSENSRRRKEAKHKRRQEEMNSNLTSVTPQVSANVVQDLVKATPLQLATSADEDEAGDEEEDSSDDDSNMSTDEGRDEGVACEGNPHPAEQSDHPVAEMLSGNRAWNERKKNQGRHKRSNRSWHHPPQNHAQSSIDPSSTAKAKHKQKEEEEKRLTRQRMSALQMKIDEYREEVAHLIRVTADTTQWLEEAKRFGRELDRQIRVSVMTN
ncbi:hypothetical protein TSMEX_007817 [Taenia solium]|eukprot:TsM_000739500 transcript=TsM_000739500 gene=TsM_000739500